MTLRADLERFGSRTPESNPYLEYFLMENPFPVYGEQVFEVCTDQDRIKGEFIRVLDEFGGEGQAAKD